MTRNGKIARRPADLRAELNHRLGHGELIKPLAERLKQRISRILGLGPGYDGSKNPELTRPPWLRNQTNTESTGANRSQPE